MIKFQAQKQEIHEKDFKIINIKLILRAQNYLPTMTHSYDITGHVTRRGA